MAAAFSTVYVTLINLEAGRVKRVRKGHPGVSLPGERLQTGLTGQYSGRGGTGMTGDLENNEKNHGFLPWFLYVQYVGDLWA